MGAYAALLSALVRFIRPDFVDGNRFEKGCPERLSREISEQPDVVGTAIRRGLHLRLLFGDHVQGSLLHLAIAQENAAASGEYIAAYKVDIDIGC